MSHDSDLQTCKFVRDIKHTSRERAFNVKKKYKRGKGVGIFRFNEIVDEQASRASDVSTGPRDKTQF